MNNSLETDIEKILRLEIERRGYRKGIDFSCQYPLRHSFIIDIAFPNEKIAVEADGSYWHMIPSQRKKDGFKTYILKSSNWQVLRFWDYEILENVTECVDRIEYVLNSKR
jgi:very-short-patch-repair endonuclease